MYQDSWYWYCSSEIGAAGGPAFLEGGSAETELGSESEVVAGAVEAEAGAGLEEEAGDATATVAAVATG